MRLTSLGLGLFILLGGCSCSRSSSDSSLVIVDGVRVVADGRTLNTAALQQAIDACHARGGGTLTLPAGKYLTGTIQLKDNVTLHLNDGATLLGSTSAGDYRNADPFKDGLGAELGHALVVAVDAKNVSLEGPGVIDGQGPALRANQTPYTVRPFLVRWVRCSNVTVQNVRLTNPGAWTMHLSQCQDATVDGVSILSYGCPNNDGIDVDSCQRVTIRNCDIDSGDDAICLKSTAMQPCTDVTVSDCNLKTLSNGIKLGTESLGGFERVRVSRCKLRDIGVSGIGLNTVDGGDLKDVVISDITMDGVLVPIALRRGARFRTFRGVDHKSTPGALRDVTIENVHATRAKNIGVLINGIPNFPVEDVTLRNIDITVAGGGAFKDAFVQLEELPAAYPEVTMFGPTFPAYGLYARHARRMTLENVNVKAEKADGRPEQRLIDVTP